MIKRLFKLLKQAAAAWSKDNVMRLSAALAYYTMLSIAPLLIISRPIRSRPGATGRTCGSVAD